MEKIKLVECFLTRQGEIFPGQRILLLRFKNCNRNCWFCDTKTKMNDFIEGEYNLSDIQKVIKNEQVGLLITGGEPSFDYNFDQTIEVLTNIEYPFAHIETNGYDLSGLYDEVEKYRKHTNPIYYIFSPKLDNGKFDIDNIKNLINKIGKNLIIKILCVPIDKDIINQSLTILSNLNFNQNIYLMPMGNNKEYINENIEDVITIADNYKLNITTRMHIIYNFR